MDYLNGATGLDFTDIDSKEKAIKEVEEGKLSELYLLPARFNGTNDARNIVFVPPVHRDLKERCDERIEHMIQDHLVNGYTCYPKYKGESFVPSDLVIEATKGDQKVYTETISIW
ncbi:hypothetical protein [Atopobacter phocae]|uniref:hypothetical protein n=1 Tax=Atopobacter phocae TaxID=136492 RepID=UPI000470A56F|nr:hypothetical protein [Atopobacter phocae]